LPPLIGVYATFNDIDDTEQLDPSALGLFVPNTNPHVKQWGTLLLNRP
jgi:hypothetical protein